MPAHPDPAAIERDGDDFAVDATLIGELLRLPPAQVQELMRSGEITSVSERGEGADAGRSRLSFFYEGRTGRVVIDATGRIISRSRINIAKKPGA